MTVKCRVCGAEGTWREKYKGCCDDRCLDIADIQAERDAWQETATRLQQQVLNLGGAVHAKNRELHELRAVIAAFEKMDTFCDIANEPPVCPACRPDDPEDLNKAHQEFVQAYAGYRLWKRAELESSEIQEDK